MPAVIPTVKMLSSRAMPLCAVPYKEAFSVEFACKEIEQQAGKQFDPRLADLFVKLVQKGKIKVILSEQKRAK